MVRQAWNGRLGEARLVSAGCGRRGSTRLGAVVIGGSSPGRVRQARLGALRQGWSRQGWAGMERRGATRWACPGWFGRQLVGLSWLGVSRLTKARFLRAGLAWCPWWLGSGIFRLGGAGKARSIGLGCRVALRSGSAGLPGCGCLGAAWSWRGELRQARLGRVRHGTAW